MHTFCFAWAVVVRVAAGEVFWWRSTQSPCFASTRAWCVSLWCCWDYGTGYPTGLSGAAIPLAARIVAVADVYDALTSERSYKEAYTPETAKRMIEEEAGSHFDPTVVEAFRECFDEFVRVQLRYPNKYVKLFGVTESLLAEICD